MIVVNEVGSFSTNGALASHIPFLALIVNQLMNKRPSVPHSKLEYTTSKHRTLEALAFLTTLIYLQLRHKTLILVFYPNS